MRKFTTIAMTAFALGAAACAKKQVAVTPPAAENPADATGATGAENGDVGLTELPGSQADMVAKAGSDTVYFGTDEFALDDASRATLAAQARWMVANRAIRASIEGHADERGTREYNLALGERRANSARAYLISQGVAEARLSVISWGKERPVAPGSNEEAWAQNRRSVTVLVR